MPLRLETITTSLEALREPWSELWDHCPSATPFQSPEWLLPWWKHLGRGRLAVVAAWDGPHLAALAPLFIRRYYGTPLRRLSLVGTGNTDYLDLLAHPDQIARALEALIPYTVRCIPGWDFADFQQLPTDSALDHAPLPAGCRDVLVAQEVCPALMLEADPERFRAAISSRMRSNLRYYQRKLEAEGGVFATADAESLGKSLDALFELHQTRWRKRRLPGVFSSARVRSFHHEAAHGFLERGWLRLHTLQLGGAIRAALYCFVCNRRGYYYAGGFDPALARLSPGTVLTGHAIEEAAQEGAWIFDFLRGDEPYKYTWGAEDRINFRRLIWRVGTPGAAALPLITLETHIEAAAKRLARRLQAGR
jgi:CelD/BcsL family acetyltransferase involved in cellulose biosynthesis